MSSQVFHSLTVFNHTVHMTSHLTVPQYVKENDIVPALGTPDTEFFLEVIRNTGLEACLERLGLLEDSNFDPYLMFSDSEFDQAKLDEANDTLLRLFDDPTADRNAVELLAHYFVCVPPNADGSVNSGMTFSALSDAVYGMIDERMEMDEEEFDTSVQEAVITTLCNAVRTLSRPIDLHVFSVRTLHTQSGLPDSVYAIRIIQDAVEHVAEHAVRAVWEDHFAQSIDMSLQMETMPVDEVQRVQRQMYVSVARALGIPDDPLAANRDY